MPDASIRNIIERLDAVNTNMVPHPNRLGGLILEPSNYHFENWWWGIKNQWGDPLGWEIGVPPAHDGHTIFQSEVNKGRSTMTAQNFDPLPLERPAFYTTQPWVPGHSPATREMGDRSGLAAPLNAPVVTLQNPDALGYKAGEWLFTYYYETKSGRKTAKAPGVTATCSQGGRFLITLPNEHVDKAHRLVLCMGWAVNGLAGTKAQRSWPIGSVPATYPLSGPFRTGQVKASHKDKNDSKVGKASQPIVHQVHSRRSLTAAKYSFIITEVHENGDSESSDPVVIEITEEIPNAALQIAPQQLSHEAIGWRAYVEMDGEEYEVFTAHSEPSSVQSTSINQKIVINGDEVKSSDSGGSTSATGSRSTGSNTSGSGSGSSSSGESLYANTGNVQNVTRKGPGGGGGSGRAVSNTSLRRSRRQRRRERRQDNSGSGSGGTTGAATTTEQDRSGIEDPTAELAVPEVLASLNPAIPGKYITGFAKTRGEFESRMGPTAEFTIPGSGGVATKIAKITLPHPINEIVNAEFQELDSNERPIDHTNAPQNGLLYASEGVLTLDSNGSRIDGLTPYHASNVVQIDRNSDYWLHADIELETHVNGTFEVVLNEYSEEFPTVNTTPLRSTFLKTQNVAGVTRYEQRMGAWGLAWHASTVSVMVLHRMTGSTRQMKVNISDWWFTSFKGGVRRFESMGGVYNPDPPQATAMPRTSYKIVTRPKYPGRPRRTLELPAFLDVQRFTGVGSTPDPLGNNWQQFNFGTGSQAPLAAAAIDGSFGYRFTKTSLSSGLCAAGKTFYPSPAENRFLAVRSLFRSTNLNSRGGMYFMAIGEKEGVPHQNDWTELQIAYLYRWKDGGIYAVVKNPNNWTDEYWVFTGIYWNTNDVMDMEIIALGAGSEVSGELRVLIGKNGARREVVKKIQWINMWSLDYAKSVVIGPYALDDWADTVVVDTDDWIVSDLGGPIVLDPPRPPLEPIPEPDRPLIATSTITEQTFEGGSAAPGTFFRSTTTNTVAEVGASYTINGALGARLSDQGSVLANVYYQEDLPTPRSAGAWRYRIRAVQRPSTGEILLARLLSSSGASMVEVYLDSSGHLWIQPVKAGGAAHGARTQVEQGITNGEEISLELILTGADSLQGNLRVFVRRNNIRRFLLDEELIDWTGLLLSRSRVGGVQKSLATTTYALDVDTVLVTEGGSQVYEEYTSDGLDIEQAYLLLLPGQPVLPGMFLHSEPIAVEPGKVYTAGIKVRWAGVGEDVASFPFWLVAYDLDGEKHDLGCLCDHPGFEGGLSGSSDGWVHLTLTLPPIPPDCYELAWESRDMQPGEYAAQSPSLSGGSEAKLFVTFPLTGYHRVLLDTRTPKQNDALMPFNRTWKSFTARHTPAEGCTVEAEGWASELSSGSDATPKESDLSLVPQRRYAWAEYNVTGDGIHTPEIPWKSPRVEYEIDVSDCLLMEDDSELPGGVVVGSDHPVEWELYEKTHVIDLESGRVVRQSTGIGVGWMAPVKLQCCALITMRFLTEWWLKRDWVIQTPTEKIRVRPVTEIKLEDWIEIPGAYHLDNEGFAYSWYELEETGRFEVVEVAPHPWLAAQVEA